MTIVRHASFRAASDELGVSASTLSHMMRTLEERLGVRLFNRTTRSVAPTEAGTKLFRQLTPVITDLDSILADITTLGSRPSGRLRINTSEAAAMALMATVIPRFVARYPDVELDLVTEGRFVDIVAEGFDAGVRLGEALPQDMIGIAFGGDSQFIVVASPTYLQEFGTPNVPEDLARHRCIRFKMPSGKMYRWEFERHDQSLRVDVEGPVTIDNMNLMVEAAAKGLGIAYVLSSIARNAIASGSLVTLLEDWTPPFPGQFLYYPSRRLVPPPLRAFIDIIREVEQAQIQ